MAESAEQLRKMQILQMADLGSARRDVISTGEFQNQARTQLARIESNRQVDQRDTAQLGKWANLHAEIRDIHGTEELDDIESGQSHRANLHAMLHPNGSQLRTYANHPYPASSAGRGGGVIGKRGRGGFVPPPPMAPASLHHAPRASIYANPVRSGRPGPRGRSTTMSAGIHLDPALNCNNNDSDARDRGRARGRNKSKGKGNTQGQVHIPLAPSRVQRPPPSANFAAKISEPEDFMSLFQSRRATESYTTSIDTIASAPMKKTPSVQKSIPPNEPRAKALLSSPSKSLSHFDPIEKTTQSTKTQATPTDISLPHIGPYLVVAPSPSAHVVPLHKTAAFKSSKGPPNTPKSPQLDTKSPPVESPTASPSKSMHQSAKSKKAKNKGNTSKVPYPEVGSITTDEIQWKVSPGEQPRKKGTASPSKEADSAEHLMPVTEAKNTPVFKATELKDSKQNVTPGSQKGKSKQKAQPRDLLSEDDPLVNTAKPARRPLKTVAIQSPGAAELAGLQFAEMTGESVPVQSIDEVISQKIPNIEVPETQSRPNDQSPGFEGVDMGQQIITELRDIRKHIHSINSRQDLPTTQDIERILESKLLQLIPTTSAPPEAPSSSEMEARLNSLIAVIEARAAQQQGINAVEASPAARRDLTPFDGHRSPPPPSSSSNSPPSADKRTHKVHVPGLSPTRSDSPDIISQFESLQVSSKLAAPLQPQRAIPTPVLRDLKVPKRTTTSDASVQVTPALGSHPKEATKKPLTLNDSIFAGPVGPVISNDTNAIRSQTATRTLGLNHPNIPKQQDGDSMNLQPTGVRTIGPAPFKPRVIGPAPSVYEPTTLRAAAGARIRTSSTQSANIDTENRSLGTSNSVLTPQQAPGRLFSMPDPTTIQQPKVNATRSVSSNRSHRQ
ncbi:uncharacterized protein N7479_003414 [Penicillium vulpinum]|uniref:Uncharacterized protein n=1 Tax=Penicillium vulpinum TaxID=29845 RepID=A0A1V6RE27_9EURO|nr:uncharacterized protein N7479_003414 [Penicillium vulpinum]KAJ5963538.1 hypothetical protein N7479_003414 [Penicillium vulpinum]OQE00052.1 hypothetical protein PENVUL_c059G03310 [Penicillium vulpinum]